MSSTSPKEEAYGQDHSHSEGPFTARQGPPETSRGDSRTDIAPIYLRLTDVGAWPHLSQKLRLGPSGRSAEFTAADPSTLLNSLLGLGRFCVDTRAGRVLHPGAYALRELSNRESLHVAVYGTRVRAHLDRVSPLVGSNPTKRLCRYSLPQIVAHVTGRLGARLVRELKGGWIKLDVACSRVRLAHRHGQLKPSYFEPWQPDKSQIAGKALVDHPEGVRRSTRVAATLISRLEQLKAWLRQRVA
jgi:hypothetical protein